MKILIDTDWFAAIQDLPKAKQNEVLTAILFYPNKTSDTNIWNKTILPNLEKGKIKYFNKLQNLKQNQPANPHKTGKKITDSDTDSTIREEYIYNNINNIESNRDNKRGIGGKEKEENKVKVHNALEIFGNSFKATDAVVGIFERPDGTKKEGIQIKNPRLMAFVRQRFDKNVLNKVSDWAIDHNQRGHTYNAASLLKLLCKFQSDVEPTIHLNHVQSEYLTFKFKGE